jgi:superfamily II DNA or RNA helicase
VQFNQEKRAFTATVLGTKLYTLHLRFDTAGKLSGADCSCPAGNDGWGCCKHMVAVLLLIREKDSQGFFRELRFRQAAKDIFNFFGDRQIAVKSTVYLEPVFVFAKPKESGRAAQPSLRLRAGQDRLYIVKDIKRFLYCMENNLELSFGKKFTFVPSRHEFKGRDWKLVQLLKEIYETEKLMERFSGGGRDTGLFPEGRACLTDSSLKRFFEIYADTPFRADILGNEQDAVRVRTEDIPVSFLLSGEGQDLLLSIDYEGSLLPLTEDGEYFYTGKDIFHISPQQSEYLKPFYLAIMYQKGRKLRFIEEDKQRFVSEILPFAEKAGKLVITEQVQSTIEKTPLEAEIYLDREGSDILADVRFIYGEQTLNPFLPQAKPAGPSEKLLIREINNEEAILDILGMADFKVKDGRVHLSGDDNIYEFVFKQVPLLQEHASVFYSENLKNMKLKASMSFSARFRLNSETDMLEFGFNAEGVDRAELAGIMAALMKKKKYYQLRNGSFINLDSREFNQLNDFIEKLDVPPEQFEREFVEIPWFKAAYLDQNIRESGIHNIERNAAFKEFVQNIREPEDMTFPLPAGLKGTLRDYQKFGFKWMKTLDFYRLGGILADDMGLGKTIQLITLLLSAKSEKGPAPSLVIVPTSLVFNWCAELDKFAPGLKYSAVIGNKEERLAILGRINDFDVVITSYPLIRRDIEQYETYGFRYCILDEAQHIKNPASRNARSVKEIKAETRFALTGTPMENNLYELWSVFDFVLPGYLFSYSRFNEKYVQPASSEDGSAALADLSRQIRPFLLRRLKKDVLNELPDKIENTMLADLTEEQKKLYLAHLHDVKGEIDKEIAEAGFEKSRIRILAALTRLRQLCCHPALFVENYEGESGKMQLLEEILQESIEGGHRILLFSQFTGVLHLIRKRLEALKIAHLYLDGSTPVTERGYLVHSFNEGLGKVFLISLKAGGTGLNLTGADTVIHFDPWWNPAVEDQATDRSYRIGQKKSVYVMKLVARGTIEEKILALQEKKRELIDAVIQPGETLLSKMTQEEIRALFD